MKKTLLIFAFLFSIVPTSYAQVNYGVDFMSRYVWRGLSLDKVPSIQPTLEVAAGNLTVGLWGNLPTAGGDHKPFQEVDLYGYYAIPIGDMSASVGFTDYMVRSYGGDGFELGTFGDAGQHLLELNLKLNGSERLPLVVQFNKNLNNKSADANKSAHTAISYPFSVAGFDLKATVGAALTKGAYYVVDKADLIETTLEIGRSFDFIPKHSTTIKVIGTYNPVAKEFYPVLGLSIWKGE
jgi:hypothetical protein